ncbi:GGDEF domain-containing protein [Ktedonobacter racemifer]|uniref:GGDEF domain-containing protein n=1 Tax=Ktedonobacter racemifer TaxID=363277 RepID=UPI00146C6DBB|nr:GGDEF domain-containing protein [Ktedonobacter racemifer]
MPLRSLLLQMLLTVLLILLTFMTLPFLLEGIAKPQWIARGIAEVFLAGAFLLWLGSLILLFFMPVLFVLRTHHVTPQRRIHHWRIVLLSLMGIVASSVCLWTTFSISWTPLLSHQQWVILVTLLIVTTLSIGWIGGEYPRIRVLLHSQQRAMQQEIALRHRLQESYQAQRLLLAALARAAVTDPVTELPNRRAIIDEIEHALSWAHSIQASCALLFVDLDHFKQVNDLWGHRVGDALLHEVGRRFRTLMTPQCIVGRYGGEEFVFVLLDASLPGAKAIAEQVRTILATQPYTWQADSGIHTITVTASIGIALSRQYEATSDDLIEQADHAMYVAKQMGRNCISIAGTTDLPT